MKPVLSPRVILLVAAIVFVALMLWVRTHPEKPVDPIMDALDELKKGMGLTVQPLPGPNGGLPVLEVEPGSPADRLGFRKGDRILTVGDRSIWHVLMLTEQLSQNLEQGRPFPVLVDSKGTYHAIVVGRGMQGSAGPAGHRTPAAGQQRGRGQ